MVDLDGDGHIDMLSGSWPGEIFFFKGFPAGRFGEAVKLKDKNGKTINIGGGRRPDSDGSILIAGDAKFEKDDKGNSIVVYEGEKIPVPKGKSAGITGTASSVCAFDWDGNGTIDLIVGDIGGSVYFVPNEGTKTNPQFGTEQMLEADGKRINIPGGDAGPTVADWDGDGKPDLIVGAGDGSVWLYRNVGTREKPVLQAGVPLVAAPPRGDPIVAARPGVRTKVCAVDFDGDGKLDLLVGDMAEQKPDRPDPTPEEKKEHDKLRKEFDEVLGTYRKLVDKLHGSKAVTDEDERKKARKELEETSERMMKLREKIPAESETHGWVWFHKRK
ncbi:MAG: FG-GAP-like repeat-containing protein [Gemmataceae bacterium]|nr:FG-GAP-like repeat-containing protein [Gemmataceae bacterium]